MTAGIFIEDGEILALAADLPPLDDAQERVQVAARAGAPTAGAEEYRLADGATAVWTDGGCTYPNRDPLFRRAGSGAWWGSRHPYNRAFPVAGPAQSNNRAELAAVLYVARVDHRSLEVRTDSQYVHDHWAALQGGATAAPSWSHRDLWEALCEALRERPATAPLRLRKVKGHATAEFVAEGRGRQEDKVGNDWADQLATQGLQQLHSPALAWRRHRLRAAQARELQAVMGAVIAARAVLLTAQREARDAGARAAAPARRPDQGPRDPWLPCPDAVARPAPDLHARSRFLDQAAARCSAGPQARAATPRGARGPPRAPRRRRH